MHIRNVRKKLFSIAREKDYFRLEVTVAALEVLHEDVGGAGIYLLEAEHHGLGHLTVHVPDHKIEAGPLKILLSFVENGAGTSENIAREGDDLYIVVAEAPLRPSRGAEKHHQERQGENTAYPYSSFPFSLHLENTSMDENFFKKST